MEPHGLTAVVPVYSSATPRRSSVHLRKASERHPLRIPPRLHSRGFLRRRVKGRSTQEDLFNSLQGSASGIEEDLQEYSPQLFFHPTARSNCLRKQFQEFHFLEPNLTQHDIQEVGKLLLS